MKKSIAMMCLLLTAGCLEAGAVLPSLRSLRSAAGSASRQARTWVRQSQVPRVRTALPLAAVAAGETLKSKRQREEQAKRLTQRHFPTLQKPLVRSRSSLSPIDLKAIAPVTVAVQVKSDTNPDAAPER